MAKWWQKTWIGRPKGAKDNLPRAKPTQAVTEARLEFEAAIENQQVRDRPEVRRHAAPQPYRHSL